MSRLRNVVFAVFAASVFASAGCADFSAKGDRGEVSPEKMALPEDGTPCALYKGQTKALGACLNAFHRTVVNKARFAGGASDKYDPCEEFGFYAPAFEACAGEFRKRIVTQAEAVGAGGFIIPQKVRSYPARYGE